MSTKEIIATNRAPSAIGPYSQAIRVDRTVYLSGQIPLDPVTMEVVTESFEAQVEQVFTNIQAVAGASRGTLENLVKINIYLTDLKNFDLVNEIMSRYFTAPYPARAAVGVLALPKGVDIEIEGIMVI